MSPYKMSKIEAPIRCALSFIDYLNTKDQKLIVDQFSNDCSFSNFNQQNSSITGIANILNYFNDFFTQNPNQQVIITDTYNFLNKAIIKFDWCNITKNTDNISKCIGIFDITKDSIKSIDIYSKK